MRAKFFIEKKNNAGYFEKVTYFHEKVCPLIFNENFIHEKFKEWLHTSIDQSISKK